MTMSIQVEHRKISPELPPFFIAELSGNHNQSLSRALEIVDAAADAGADALKLQTYTADTITLDLREREFFIDDPKSLWYGKSLYELYEEAYTPWDWHEPIFLRCRQRGLVPMSTPFDFSAVDFLEKFDLPAYKIASPENIDLPLINKVAATGKPIIISTGMASFAELQDVVNTVHNTGNRQIILLKCTTAYPASPSSFNLKTIPDLAKKFGVLPGLSDHSKGIAVSIAAVSMGACVVEKHLTLRRDDGGVDSAFSLEPEEFAAMVKECKQAWEAIGSVSYGPTESEIPSLRGRRSLYFSRDLQAGDALTPENVRSIRPGLGLPPKHYNEVMGKKVKSAVTKGTPLSWNIIA
jgi:pseudaminic acid synthase